MSESIVVLIKDIVAPFLVVYMAGFSFRLGLRTVDFIVYLIRKLLNRKK